MGKLTTFSIALITAFFLGLPLFSALKQHLTASKQPAASTQTPEAPLQNNEVAAAARPKRPPVMTRSHFARLKHGMSYAQCISVIGVQGEATGSGRSGAAGVTATYRWLDPEGANEFVLGFRNGRLASKSMNMSRSARTKAQATHRAIQAQTSVIRETEVRRLEQAARQARRAIVITLDEFNRIQRGITYAQCVAIIGAENPMARGYTAQRNAILSGKGGSNTLTEAYKWRNPGGYYAEIAFHNGRVTKKTWKKGP